MSRRSVSFLTYLAALRCRPELFALYAAAQRGSLLDAHRFFAAVRRTLTYARSATPGSPRSGRRRTGGDRVKHLTDANKG